MNMINSGGLNDSIIRPSLAWLSATTNADISTRVAGATPGLRRSLLGALGSALVGALHILYETPASGDDARERLGT